MCSVTSESQYAVFSMTLNMLYYEAVSLYALLPMGVTIFCVMRESVCCVISEPLLAVLPVSLYMLCHE